MDPVNMKRLALSALSFFCATAVFIWMVVFNIRPIQDPDVWWHLASGRYMVTNQVIPKTDVFSLTAQGSAWRRIPTGCKKSSPIAWPALRDSPVSLFSTVF